MKKLFLICALCGAGALTARSQTIAVMADQLAELRLYDQTTADGYQLMTTGLDSIGGITSDEYQLHAGYFASLNILRPGLADDPILTTLRDLQTTLLEQLQDRIAWWRQQQPIN